ncbi:MAG: NADH-quinone oxidoreductase subunit N [Thermoguttaceae bacterium]|nr:NADH-quinone oxidoreductase subunit N [Thermoguttaceae bacterium]MDW8079044.1 NADH-quinone oxidoreductase subunit N [Thermoguttaceae bacterium]
MERLLAEKWSTSSGELLRWLEAVAPEIALTGTIVFFLISRMLFPRFRYGAHIWAMAGAFLAVALALGAGLRPVGEIFSGVLVHDEFGRLFRIFLLCALVLFVVFTSLSRIPPPVVATEFYLLVFGATLGMCFMATANHLVMVMLGAEMASLPGYALVGIKKQDRLATEAALKYAIFGAATSGIMFFGLSLLAALTGAVHLPTMTARLASMGNELFNRPAELSALTLGLIFVVAGLGFKLSLVPFHFWTPDVFEGATAEVGGFLSVASKLAALALLTRLLVAWGAPLAQAEVGVASDVSLCLLATDPSTSQGSPTFVPLRPANTMGNLLGLVAALTCTFGNLAAYGQTNLKRLLAYSTIAHAGYLAMGIGAAAGTLPSFSGECRQLLASVIFYASVYLLMNLGIFATTAFLRNKFGTEEIDALAGGGRDDPALLVAATVFLFSLTGLPPLAGFMAKFVLFAAMARAGFWSLVLIGVVNTVFSLFYYLRIVRVLAIDEPRGMLGSVADSLSWAQRAFLLGLAAALVILGIWWGGLFAVCERAATSLLALG